jgi:hypothetical protein
MSPPLISKAAARYTGAGGREHCSLCRHFSPRRGGRCARVLGDISPRGWCKLFSREMRGLVADASSFNGGGGGPSLSLDFMTPGVLDPRITFTRASTGTYFDAAGVMQTAAINTPRWDYDPATLQLRGLLIEEARTNLLLNSATLSTQSVTVTAVAYTLSFTGTGTITRSGVSTGSLVGTGATQRVSVTFTPTAGSLTCTVTGSVTNAQLEAGAFATSYIPTTSAAVTRAADVASMPIGTWFNAAQSSLAFYGDVLGHSTATSRKLIVFDNGTAAERVVLGLATSTSAGLVFSAAGGVTQGLINLAGVVVPTTPFKFALAINSSTTAACLNAGTASSVSTGTLTVAITRLVLSDPPIETQQHCGHISRISYWSRALSGAELQAVTT